MLFPAVLQGDWTLACPVLLRNPRRNQVAPSSIYSRDIISHGAAALIFKQTCWIERAMCGSRSRLRRASVDVLTHV